MRNLLPLLIIVLLTSACKEDKATIQSSQNKATTSTTKVTESTSTVKTEVTNAQSESKTSTGEVATKPQSAQKTSTTVKVRQPTGAAASNIRVAEPVVKTEVRNNSLSVTTHKAPEKVMDNYPFDIDLKNVDGQVVKSSEIFKKNGKPTVLLFWLTTCRPCHMKMEAIKPLYPQWKEEADFNVYAISGDYPQNYPNFVKQVNKKGWEWETYNDVNRGFRDILPGGLNGFPQTFIFDKNGKLVYQDKKFNVGDEVKLFEKIKQVSNS